MKKVFLFAQCLIVLLGLSGVYAENLNQYSQVTPINITLTDKSFIAEVIFETGENPTSNLVLVHYRNEKLLNVKSVEAKDTNNGMSSFRGELFGTFDHNDLVKAFLINGWESIEPLLPPVSKTVYFNEDYEKNYGYVLQLMQDTDTTDDVYARMFTTKAEGLILSFANEVMVSGVILHSNELLPLEIIKVNDFIKYELDSSGKICEVMFATPSDSDSDFTLDATYFDVSRFDYFKQAFIIGAKTVYLSPYTIIMRVPYIYEGLGSESYDFCRILRGSDYMESFYVKNISAYNIDENGFASMIVINDEVMFNVSSEMAIVKSTYVKG